MRIDREIARLIPSRKGHFRLESGHHGDLWLELEPLCFQTEPIRALSDRLSAQLSRHDIEIICGPLIEGAFVSLMVAEKLKLSFAYSEPRRSRNDEGLFPMAYRIPGTLRSLVVGRRVAVVNDVINAGSAVRGTLQDLLDCGAEPVVIGALAVLGPAAGRLADENRLPLETLCELPNAIWRPSECPLCAKGVPLNET